MSKERRACVVCGANLDTLFEKARPNVVTCSNKCRQKRYRERKRELESDEETIKQDYVFHSIDEARLNRIRSFVSDCKRGLNPYQVRPNKGPGGLHASPNPSVTGFDT